MVERLEQAVRPGERVVFRTERDWRDGIRIIAILAVVVAGGALAVWWILRAAGGWIVIFGLSQLVPWIAIFGLAWHPAVIVTERRLLHRTLRRPSRIRDIALARVEGVESAAGQVTVLLGGGERHCLQFLPDPDALAGATAAAAGVPAAMAPRLPPRLARWHRRLGWSEGLGALAAVAACTYLYGASIEFLGVDRQYAGLLPILFFLPLGPFLIMFGAVAGAALAALGLSRALGPAEAQALFAHVFAAPPTDPIDALVRTPTAVARRVAGRLYGTPV